MFPNSEVISSTPKKHCSSHLLPWQCHVENVLARPAHFDKCLDLIIINAQFLKMGMEMTQWFYNKKQEVKYLFLGLPSMMKSKLRFLSLLTKYPGERETPSLVEKFCLHAFLSLAENKSTPSQFFENSRLHSSWHQVERGTKTNVLKWACTFWHEKNASTMWLWRKCWINIDLISLPLIT